MKIRRLAAFCIGLLLLYGCGAEKTMEPQSAEAQSAEQLPEKALQVNDTTYTAVEYAQMYQYCRGQVGARLADYYADEEAMIEDEASAEEYAETLESMTVHQLAYLAVIHEQYEARGLQIDANEVQQEYDTLVEQCGGEQVFLNYLQEKKISREMYMRLIENKFEAQMLAESIQDQLSADRSFSTVAEEWVDSAQITREPIVEEIDYSTVEQYLQ